MTLVVGLAVVGGFVLGCATMLSLGWALTIRQQIEREKIDLARERLEGVFKK